MNFFKLIFKKSSLKVFLKWLFSNIFIVFFIGLLLWSANQIVEEKMHANNLLFALQNDIIKISGDQQNIKYEQRGATYRHYFSPSRYVILPINELNTKFYDSLNSDEISLIWTIYRSWDIDNFYQDVKYLKALYNLQDRLVFELKQMPSQELINSISNQRDKIMSETDEFINTTNEIIDKEFVEFNFLSNNYSKFKTYIFLHFKVLKDLIFRKTSYNS